MSLPTTSIPKNEVPDPQERLFDPDLFPSLVPVSGARAQKFDGKPFPSAGKCPGLMKADGRCSPLPTWTVMKTSERPFRDHVARGGNIGLRGTASDALSFAFIDIDTPHPDLARLAREMAISMLGDTVVRYSSGNKCALIYRAPPGGLPRMSITLEHPDFPGVKQTIEVLSKGRQIVIHGRHANGVDIYRLDREFPPVSSLPLISAGDVAVTSYLGHFADEAARLYGALVIATTNGRSHEITEEQKAALEGYAASEDARSLIDIACEQFPRPLIKQDVTRLLRSTDTLKNISEGIEINPGCFTAGVEAAKCGLVADEAIFIVLAALQKAIGTRDEAEWADRYDKAPGAVTRGWESGWKAVLRSGLVDFSFDPPLIEDDE